MQRDSRFAFPIVSRGRAGTSMQDAPSFDLTARRYVTHDRAGTFALIKSAPLQRPSFSNAIFKSTIYSFLLSARAIPLRRENAPSPSQSRRTLVSSTSERRPSLVRVRPLLADYPSDRRFVRRFSHSAFSLSTRREQASADDGVTTTRPFLICVPGGGETGHALMRTRSVMRVSL